MMSSWSRARQHQERDLRTLGGFRGGGDQLLFGVFEKP